jgi:uncharacterized protein (TIGR02466 family)
MSEGQRLGRTGIFPSRIFCYDLPAEEARALNAALFAEIDRLFTPRPNLQQGQNFQTHHDLHRNPAVAPLMQVVNAALEETLAALKVVHRGFAVTGCWANMNPAGVPHAPHSHPNNLLAGVYYVRADAGADRITFHEPRPQIYTLWPRPQTNTMLNASHWSIPVKPGRVIVFPAWLMHSVPPNRSQGPRLSISFNAMLLQPDEVLPPLAWQQWSAW